MSLSVLAWCEHLLRGEVLALALRCGGRLVGLAPLFRYRDGAARVLALTGAGFSDYQDVLVEPAFHGRALRALRRWLLERATDWER